MRAGVWCGAAALALLTLASALRTAQVEGATRASRRLPAPSAPEDQTENIDDVPTFKPRTFKRREDVDRAGEQRVRTRSRPAVEVEEETSNSSSQIPSNGRFDSRRTYSRTRNRPIKVEANPNLTGREYVPRSRTRPSSRERQNNYQVPPAVSSPKIEGTKFESRNPTTYKPKLTEFSVTTPRTSDTITQFKQRSSTSPTTESFTTRRRGRINTRVDTRALDLAVSGTTNTITVNSKEPTTARTADDLRNSRKLRYRTRFSETDTNLTGEGIQSNNKVSTSSQNKDNITSQPEIQTVTSDIETTVQSSTDTSPAQSTLPKLTKVERRPLTRGKGNFRPAVSLKKKHSDEISEDDNYPESFKALIQAKNASTQSSSPSSESLSVKASQNVYKTYTSSPQSTHNGPPNSKYARFRSKISAIDEPKMEESKTEIHEGEILNQSAVTPEQNKPKVPEFRLRSSYNPRNRKISNFSMVTPSAAASVSSEQKNEKPLYKYNRKFKPSTTETPKIESTSKFKRLGTNTLLKKSLSRPSYNSRRNSSKSLDTSSEGPGSIENDNTKKDSNMTHIKTLPRTSYYSRLRSKNNESVSTSSTETNTGPSTETSAGKKIENSAEMPLVFSLMKNFADGDIRNTTDKEGAHVSTNEPEKERKMFIIAVTSKESSENSTENEVPNKTEEIDDKMFVDHLSSTQKFHANFKNKDSDIYEKTEIKDQEINQSTPRSRNYQSTRRNGRKRTKPEHYEEISEVTPKTRERNSQRKYTEGFTKSTEPSTNGIPFEPEKQKSRYSSKYRTSYLDKPYYKPTIPTVTPSTAWLKFFVTDPQLAKSVEEPYWFEGDDIFVTTEMSRHTSTTSPSSHESSLELVKGEELQLGPDMNAISFTKTRSTLSSADLRLSESLDKPSHIMNVEASQHSPSVTVSIFDALADILTSTPRTPRLSSTTDVTQKQNINDITLNGVSNSITVNNIRGLASQDTFTTIADVNSNNKFVQTTAQTPTVINSQPVEETVTPSLNTKDGNVNPVNTPTLPTPSPTTPVSLRRPFAIKVLYTDTESPTDKSTTTESIRISTQPSTDIPETVLNTVSDFLLTNNHLVSAELTSMLSNNIKYIMQNMDKETRSKISVDMAKLLKTLIPRALDGLSTGNDDIDKIPDTTPYSLEEIRDTGNISIDNNTANFDILDKNDISISESLQSVVTDNTVNSKSTSIGTTLGVTESPTLAVNSGELLSSITLSVSSSQMTSVDETLSTAAVTAFKSSTSSTITSNTMPTPSSAMSSASSDTESINVDGDGNRVGTDDTNTNVPFPFLTNFKVRDFTVSDTSDMDSSSSSTLVNPLSSTQSIPLTKSVIPEKNNISKISIEKQDSSHVGPLQLWVLNKKARVLQMIEDLLRKHNTEIQTVSPMTELLNQPNNIPLSNRLTEILNTMISTTETSDITTESNTFPTTTQSISSFPFVSTQVTPADTGENPENDRTTSIFTSIFGDMMSTTTQAASDIFSRLAFTGSDTLGTQASTVNFDTTASTTPSTPVQESDGLFKTSEESSTTQVSTKTTTEVTNTDTVQIDTEFTSTTKLDITSEVSVSSTTNEPVTETKQNFISVVNNKVNIPNEPPKKDYVIFGILPNNTVVRKDPNDDILETLTEASPYIVYSLLSNNTVIRRFPNGTRVPRVMQRIDVLPISPWTLRNPYSPIHNNPAIVRPHNPIRVSTNIVTSSDTSNNGTENRLTIDTVNNQQTMIPTTLNIKDRSSLGVTTASNKPPAEKSTASHVLSLRTSTMLPSVDEILLNSISSAVKEEMVISSMMSSTREPTILTLDIDPETGQIRTEKPGDGNERTVFKYIPIDEVTVAPQGTNVLKLASTKAPSTQTMSSTETFATVTEIITQTPQIQTRQQINDPTTTEQMIAGTSTPIEVTTIFTNHPATTDGSSSPRTTVALRTEKEPTSTEPVVTTLVPITTSTEATTTIATSTSSLPMVTAPPTTVQSITLSTIPVPTTTNIEEEQKLQEEVNIFATERNAKSLNVFNTNNQMSTDSTSTVTFTNSPPKTTQTDETNKLLQAILAANSPNLSTVSLPNLGGNVRINTGAQTSTSRSIEDDIRQFEEDTKLLKALLAATGQNPANLNIPSLENLNIPTRATTPLTPATQRTTTMRTTSTPSPTTIIITPQVTTTTYRAPTTTQSVSEDLRKLTEDAKLLQALLQATGQNFNNAKPIITGVTSNVRIASDPKTTTIGSNPTTPVNVRPIFASQTTPRPAPVFSTLPPVLTTLQQSTTTEASRVAATTQVNTRRRVPVTTTVATARRAPSPRFTVTTEIPSTSTFTDEEDLQFLQNLKSVLNNNPNPEDPEAGLANRIIALAVERSLNEIESGKQANDGRTGKTVVTTPITRPITTTIPTTTTTTTARTTTIKDNTPSLEDDIKQFQEDTKLLQELLKATGQDPSKFNIPTLPPIMNSHTKVSPQLSTRANDDLKLLSNLLASPSPLNEPFDSLTEKPKPATPTTPRPFGAKIVVKDNLKTEKDDAKLLQTLVKLQGVTETTTQRSKLAITGQSSEEALKKLVQQTKTPGMMSDATKAPVSISTEYGKSNDALLAALLKEQGFGPTTASSLDEQLRLAALLNQVVVTPKARRTTTTPPPPPPPPQRRPILDGLAWLWQQWRDTDPGRPAARPNRRPLIPSSAPPSASSSNRVPWFGSGPFVGNADEQPSSNRVPLEPPRVVTSEQAPGRGQLVSAAINVTRAFSQFLGAAIAGAAQTVQSVIRAGQRATADAYTTGSG